LIDQQSTPTIDILCYKCYEYKAEVCLLFGIIWNLKIYKL